jgi:NAD(P)-dependent dehydrogenase (short-subunit alcohol dehydrogenase family)
MHKQINDMVVVITGTTSGIGKAAALAFAQEGARVAMGARRKPLLEESAAACRNAGADVLALQTDVSDPDQVQALADRTIEEFGRIDVWINNAGMDCFGPFEDIPAQSFERVIEINLFGTANGARAVLPHFRERQSGVMINNASMVGACPSPFHTAYVASKYAIRGFSQSLRQELIDLPDVHVCVISPASIDTPLWQRAGNYSGRKVKALDPVYPPEQVADMMVDLARFPEREVFAGAAGWMLAEQHTADPDLTEMLFAGFVRQDLFLNEPAEPTDGALFEPGEDNGGTHGGWLSPDKPNIPGSDVISALAAPALLAMVPPLYAWKLSCNTVQQLGRQFTNHGIHGPMPNFGPTPFGR